MVVVLFEVWKKCKVFILSLNSLFLMKKILFNKALRILLITNGLILLSGAMLGPIYALFVEEIGGSLLDASFAGALFALAAGITTLIAGRYADKTKRSEYVVATGYLVMGLGFILYTQVRSIWFLFAVQLLIGFKRFILLLLMHCIQDILQKLRLEENGECGNHSTIFQ